MYEKREADTIQGSKNSTATRVGGSVFSFNTCVSPPSSAAAEWPWHLLGVFHLISHQRLPGAAGGPGELGACPTGAGGDPRAESPPGATGGDV